MKKLLLPVLLIAAFSLSFVQAPSGVYKQALDLIAQMKETQAYPLLLDAAAKEPKNVDVLCDLAYYAAREGNRQKDTKARDKKFITSKYYAEQAVKLAPNNAEAQYVYSVALGRMALVASSSEKVKMSRQIYEIIQKALKLNPNHAGAWHALGKWNYEVCELSFVEKAAVDYLFGGLPTGDMKTSLNAFKKSIALNPGMMIYRYDYAIALEANDQEKEAIAVMKQILSMKQITQDDAGIQADAKRMIDKWS